ncbi:MAG: hypothetical protein R3E77_01980 [Steroidobacteraceae bacterium]
MPARLFTTRSSRPLLAVLGMALLLPSTSALAITRITVQASRLAVPGNEARGVRLTIDLGEGGDGGELAGEIAALQLRAADWPQPLRDLRLRCARLSLSEDDLACRGGVLRMAAGPFGRQQARLELRYSTVSSTGRLAVSQLRLGDGQAQAELALARGDWRASAQLDDAGLKALRPALPAAVQPPTGFDYDGRLGGKLKAQGSLSSGPRDVQIDAEFAGLAFSNEDGSVAGEKLRGTVALQLDFATVDRPRLDITLRGNGGQALTSAAFLDFDANPSALTASGTLIGKRIDFGQLRLEQSGLLEAVGSADIDLNGPPWVLHARATIDRLQFPAAYTSYLQLALAATDFGRLDTAGHVAGTLEVAADRPVALSLATDRLEIDDRKGHFFMHQLAASVHWLADPASTPAASWISWQSGGAYGLSGAAARIDFRARGSGFELTRSTRLPIFDGALDIARLAASNLGSDELQISFNGQIEPISMPRLCAAFGWPEFAGTLGGTIPDIDYRNRELTVAGDVIAQVFGGRVSASKLKLRDPLGNWPRLFADVRLEDLDLAQVTSTFAIGAITGRLEGALAGLELFDWSPIAFDARLGTPPNDRSRHRISAKAVGNLANVGGGGGGVIQALQSGFLQFFDEYSYSALGISCKLRDEVCQMGGIGRSEGDGYYIVRGSGIPRIDIVGSQRRVDWPRLVAQIAEGMRNSDSVTIK